MDENDATYQEAKLFTETQVAKVKNTPLCRVSVQRVKSLGSHFACLCRGFEFYEVKKKLLLFFKKKMEILLHF